MCPPSSPVLSRRLPQALVSLMSLSRWLATRLVQQSLEKAAEKEKRIRELRVERKNFHLKLQGMLDMFQQVLNFDKEEEDLDASVSVMRPKRKDGEAV